MRSLKQMPQRFPYFDELYITPNKYHKMFIAKCYLVLYQIQDDTVYIEYSLDCRKEITTESQVAIFSALACGVAVELRKVRYWYRC